MLLPASSRDGVALRWEDLAPSAFRPESDFQWADLCAGSRPAGVEEPPMGSPDGHTVARLLHCLEVPDAGTFRVAQWVGYVEANYPEGAAMGTLPPGRESAIWDTSVPGLLAMERIPMRWWDSRLDWSVGNDVYARSLFVSGSHRAIGRVLAGSGLEAYPVDFADPVGAEDW